MGEWADPVNTRNAKARVASSYSIHQSHELPSPFGLSCRGTVTRLGHILALVPAGSRA